MIEIPSPAGAIPAHTAMIGMSHPGLVIVPTIFGVDQGMRKLADSFARAHINAAVIDPFWRLSPPGPLGFSDGERAAAQARAAQISPKDTLADVLTVIAWMRGRCCGTPAALGVCFGGRFAVLVAARGEVSAAITWHGGGMLSLLELAPLIKCPLAMHFGESDDLIPLSEVARLRNTFGWRKNVSLHLHPDVGHGFSHRGHPGFAPVAANAAFAQTRRLIHEVVPTE